MVFEEMRTNQTDRKLIGVDREFIDHERYDFNLGYIEGAVTNGEYIFRPACDDFDDVFTANELRTIADKVDELNEEFVTSNEAIIKLHAIAKAMLYEPFWFREITFGKGTLLTDEGNLWAVERLTLITYRDRRIDVMVHDGFADDGVLTIDDYSDPEAGYEWTVDDLSGLVEQLKDFAMKEVKWP